MSIDQAFSRESAKVSRQRPTLFRRTLVFLILCLLGIGVHLGWYTDWLAWQPLWADEGYSVYFATEAPARLLWLTANDIHPPLYYLLLHTWIKWWSTPDPLALRLFSVLLAAPVLGLGWALAIQCFPGRRRPQWIFLLLLLLNPLYLYYSQEIRMYGLALSLSMASTLCCWQWLQQRQTGKAAAGWLMGYCILAILALYTLYYLAFLLLTHLIWVGWCLRRQRADLLRWLLADSLIGLFYLPWVIYTARILLAYVNDKVRSDQDLPLDPFAYLLRHLRAFTSGHLSFPELLTLLPWAAVAVTLGLLLWAAWQGRRSIAPGPVPAHRSLWLLAGLPIGIGFLINLVYPFFPVGGERLLLFTLPYLLLMMAGALDDLWRTWRIGPVALLLLATTAAVGDWVFYTLPRYQSDDYRPLIRQMIQAGTDQDTVLATFPWQVGLWRAYAPAAGLEPDAGPRLHLLSERSVEWGPTVIAQIDAALAQGMVWVPSLRSIGSTLPAAMDAYLAEHAVNFVQQWSSPTTRLDAWRRQDASSSTPLLLDWGDVQLVSTGVTTSTIPAANFPLVVTLGWQIQADLPPVGVTLRLQKDNHTWAQRDYPALGMFATQRTESALVEQVGLIVPAGLPPGDYTLVIGLIGNRNSLRPLRSEASGNSALAPLATLTITAPPAPLAPARLPIQQAVTQPVVADGVTLLGYSGSEDPQLAGTPLTLTLFWQKQGETLADRHLYVSLLDKAGAGVAGWEGWPLPSYPLSQWQTGALVQLPVSFLIPATVKVGTYRLVGGLLDPTSGSKQLPVPLGEISVYQRPANFTPLTPPVALAEAAQFGTHVQLLGYDLQLHGEQLDLFLYWQVLQPIVPAHHLFVHLDDAAGTTLAQADGEPQTTAGFAPTGSWQPGEFLVTAHYLTSPALADPTTVLRIGLYEPATEARLPLSIAGTPAGDALVIDPGP